MTEVHVERALLLLDCGTGRSGLSLCCFALYHGQKHRYHEQPRYHGQHLYRRQHLSCTVGSTPPHLGLPLCIELRDCYSPRWAVIRNTPLGHWA